MASIHNSLFRAIHEGRWLNIEYKNMRGETTHYWFGIENIDAQSKKLTGKGLHLGTCSLGDLTLNFSGIQSAEIVSGTYMEINEKLEEDISLSPSKYEFMFPETSNMKVLNYLSDCNKLESVPSLNNDFHLVEKFDDDTATPEQPYKLSFNQFKSLVDGFKKDADTNKKNGQKNIKQLAINKLSINTDKGLYVLAYREVLLDIVEMTLKASPEISFNKEFAFSEDGAFKLEKESITKFLDISDLWMLEEFDKNIEKIEDAISEKLRRREMIDDLPYFLCLQRRFNTDLDKEYESIMKMQEEKALTVPLQAFFGQLRRLEPNENPAPIALLNNKVNLDQLLSIYNAMNCQVSYIQGPPGTGKTNTIINTIVTAFFNEKTVLFSSYNNHPIDTVFKTLSSLDYHRQNGQSSQIPFPILRLGNNEKVSEAIEYINDLRKRVKNEKIYSSTLSKNKGEKIESTKRLVALLKRHQEIVDLQERKDTLEAMMETAGMEFSLTVEGDQLTKIKKRLKEIGEITDKDALELLESSDDFMKYMYFTSANYIKRLENPEYEDLRAILDMENSENRTALFNKYTSMLENLQKLQKVFPIIATTCLSAHRIGPAHPSFDMTIIDEASQCNTAVSLVPVTRGRTLMLVGDPQQLNPVITLDIGINNILKEKYSITDDYDYITHSIYKAFLANDSVSEEILLRNHYRCAKEIIEFNNKKYYGGQLRVFRESRTESPLEFFDVKDSEKNERNSSSAEADKIVSYIKKNQDKSIGVITPFRNQKELIAGMMKEAGLDSSKYTCGTVHAFQGDEKDTVLFSLALTDSSGGKTYEWLKNNRELINVATSRAKDKLVIVADSDSIVRLHNETADDGGDDLFELVNYVKKNGEYKIAPRENSSRALGTKPYKTETEQAFLTTLNHAISNIIETGNRFTVHSEVAISQVFESNISNSDFFYKGRFDFVIYKIGFRKREIPVLAIELNGREHYENEKVKRRDAEKKKICQNHGFTLIQVENSYARRYNFIKMILTDYFKSH